MQHHPHHEPSAFEQQPVQQLRLGTSAGVREYVEMLRGGSYQGRELGRALHVFDRMLETRTVIFLALAGAMIPAGMRGLIVDLLENRLIDGIVSTGANVIHDIVETMGQPHYAIDPTTVNDSELGELKLNRVYDTILPEEGFVEAEHCCSTCLTSSTARDPTTRASSFTSSAGAWEKKGLAVEW